MSNSDQGRELPRMTRSPIDLDDCGLAATAELIGDRWTLLILRSIFYGVRRFADIKDDISIPGSTLSSRIRRLLDSGVLEERSYRDGSSRARNEYYLTEVGESLRTVLVTLMLWGDSSLRQKPSRLVAVSKSTREKLELRFVNRAGRAVGDNDVAFMLND